MLSREDFYMIKQMRQQGAYTVDIATRTGCSERTVRRHHSSISFTTSRICCISLPQSGQVLPASGMNTVSWRGRG